MRNYYKYVLYQGNTIVYVGITNDLDRRTNEHKRDGKRFSDWEKIGNACTKESAEYWETERLETYMRNHNGYLPLYNKTANGK